MFKFETKIVKIIGSSKIILMTFKNEVLNMTINQKQEVSKIELFLALDFGFKPQIY